MQATMRKKKMQITDQAQVEGILERGKVLFLAMCQGDQPYVLPLNYGYVQGCIYIHTGHKGLKMEMLAQNPKVSFSLQEGVEMVPNELPCKWDTNYRSVVGFGRVSTVDDPAEKIAGLEAVSRQAGHDGPMEFPPEKVRQLTLLKIDIDQMIGKQSPAG
jgi:uncharacterized protein